MTPFADFYGTLRMIVGDNDPYQVYDYQDSQLDGALRSVFLLGLNPDGYKLTGTDRNTANKVVPDIPTGDPFALISYEAALLLTGNEAGSSFYKTRALSVKSTGEARKTLLSDLRHRIYEIKGGRTQFVSIQSFETWLHSISSPLELAPLRRPPVFDGISPSLEESGDQAGVPAEDFAISSDPGDTGGAAREYPLLWIKALTGAPATSNALDGIDLTQYAVDSVFRVFIPGRGASEWQKVPDVGGEVTDLDAGIILTTNHDPVGNAFHLERVDGF